MRRRAALASALAFLLTSCGLAALSTPALAPHSVARPDLAEAVAAAPAAREQNAETVKDLGAPPAPQPVVVPMPALPAATLGPMKHVWQSLNNCGPAAVVMALSALGIDESQEVARLALRGTDPRRGMGPQRVGPWVDQRYGLRSVWRISGTNDVIKQLVTNGFAPMVTQWMQDPTVSRISHWRTVRGYDDARGVFYVNDPMLGNNVALPYSWFAKNWQSFSYRYMVIYQPQDEALLRSIVGAHWDDYTMRERHYDRMKAEAAAEGTSAAWIAYGEAAYQFGLFEEAVTAIEKGLALGSGTGIFMLRTSLPNALRALGRFDEAEAAQRRLSNITPGVSPASSSVQTTFRLDRAIAAAVAERERRQRVWERNEHVLLTKLDRLP
ncbi:MAG: C39 family peptidase [Candidatus Limnocylindria bacterium]